MSGAHNHKNGDSLQRKREEGDDDRQRKYLRPDFNGPEPGIEQQDALDRDWYAGDDSGHVFGHEINTSIFRERLGLSFTSK